MDIKSLIQTLADLEKQQPILTESTDLSEEGRKVSGHRYGGSKQKDSDDSDDAEDNSKKSYNNPFDSSAALKAHEKFGKGKEVKGRAQSSDVNKKKDDLDEGLNFKSYIGKELLKSFNISDH